MLSVSEALESILRMLSEYQAKRSDCLYLKPVMNLSITNGDALDDVKCIRTCD